MALTSRMDLKDLADRHERKDTKRYGVRECHYDVFAFFFLDRIEEAHRENNAKLSGHDAIDHLAACDKAQ